MRIFTILEPPDGKPDNVALVPEGFSWGALIFTFFWALWHRMWVIAALLFVLSTALTVAASLQLFSTGFATMLQFAIALVFGFEARNLQVLSLEGSGYRRAGLVQATSEEAAELTYFSGRAPAAVPTPAPARPRAGPEDTLGIFGNV